LSVEAAQEKETLVAVAPVAFKLAGGVGATVSVVVVVGVAGVVVVVVGVVGVVVVVVVALVVVVPVVEPEVVVESEVAGVVMAEVASDVETVKPFLLLVVTVTRDVEPTSAVASR
jgi:hypothetical protein